MLTGFHVLIYGRDWGRMGLAIIFYLSWGCCFVSMLVVVFKFFGVCLYLCPYIHPKFPSIISDGRGYLGTKGYMGKVGLFCFFFFLSLLFLCFSPNLRGAVVGYVGYVFVYLFVVGYAWGMPLVNL